MRTGIVAAGFALAAATLLAAGCGSDGESATATSGSSTPTPQAMEQTAPAGAGTESAGAGTESAGAASQGQAAAKPAGGQRLALRLVRVASGFDDPTHIAATPSEPNRLYVVEQPGRIRVIENGRVLPQPFLDIVDLVGSGGERGLLSMAFHPRYASNGLFYVDYTDRNGDTRVVEYRARGGGEPTRVRELLFVDQPYPNHNGGQLMFGPDGRLYVGMGDGGSQGDPENRAQNLSSRLGKLLALDVDDPNADWQVVGYGLRNPWRFSFDRRTGDLWIGDVGGSQREEIDFVPRSNPGLKNYGWDVFEGTLPFEDKEPNTAGTLVRPIYQYPTGQGGSCAVTGGFVYRGAKIPAARGRYFFGDYCSGRVWSLVERNGRAANVKRHAFIVPQLSSFGENPKGELFLASQTGVIYRLAQG